MVAFDASGLKGRKLVLRASVSGILASFLEGDFEQFAIPMEYLAEVKCDAERRQLCARCGFATTATINKQIRFSECGVFLH